jgi:starvation-inducible DNA-binding protein
MNNKNITKALQSVLSNSYALYLKTQNYHWNVTGPHFNNLHQLFGTHYEDLAVAIDDIAERIRALEVLVPASFVAFDENSKIKNGNEKSSASQMARDLYEDNQKLSELLNEALKEVQKEGDEATADMLISRIKIHDKNAWMLKNSI